MLEASGLAEGMRVIEENVGPIPWPSFQKVEGVPALSLEGGVVEYRSTIEAFRGVGNLLSGYEENPAPFCRMGVMLDLSRNAVPDVEWMKGWFCRLALLGFDHVHLYMEDTYQLPDEPWFGYLRGGYSAADLRELDDTAHALGIELIGCIQTLGHMEQILIWPEYRSIKDTAREMRTDVPESLQLIEKILDFFSENLRSRTLHIGMDETQALGTGSRLRQKGFTPQSEIFMDHLNRVVALCEERGLRPMMWNDMLFAMGNEEGEYYRPDLPLRQEVGDRFPSQAEMVYWDYYHDDPGVYRGMIQRCREVGIDPLVASGVWTWSRLSYDPHMTLPTARACIEVCRELGVRELFFTMWGDDGGFCEWRSADAGLVQVMEMALGRDPEGEGARERCRNIAGLDLASVMARGAMHRSEKPDGVGLLWDDPILGIFLHNERLKHGEAGVLGHLDTAAGELAASTPMDEVAHGHAQALALYLGHKALLFFQLEASQAEEAKATCASALEAMDELISSFRAIWVRRNRNAGLEVVQNRLGGQRLRVEEVRDRLNRGEAFPEMKDRPTRAEDRLWTTHALLSAGSHPKLAGQD